MLTFQLLETPMFTGLVNLLTFKIGLGRGEEEADGREAGVKGSSVTVTLCDRWM